jgi:hypothetical protein
MRGVYKMKEFRILLYVAITLIIIFLLSQIGISSEKRQKPPLHVFLEIHLDNSDYPDKKVVDDVSKTLQRIAGIMEKHNLRATFLSRPQYAEASFKYGDSTLKNLQRRGHDIGIHTHLYPQETDSFTEGFNALKALGISNIISANPGFILRPQMPFEVRNQMAQNFKKTLEKMKENGIKIYSGSFGHGSYSPYSPFRPAGGYYYPDPSGVREIKTSTTGLFVALHGVPAGPYMWAAEKDLPVKGERMNRPVEQRVPPSGFFKGMPESNDNEREMIKNGMPVYKEIQETEMIEAVRPKLERALKDTTENYPYEFNYLPIAIHELEFMDTKVEDGKRIPVYNEGNKGFPALDRFLTEVIDPLIKEGKVQWVTMAELYYKYIEFEKKNLK